VGGHLLEPAMKRVACLLLGAAALAACGGSAHSAAKPRHRSHPARGTALAIGPTSQFDLAQHRPLPVIVRSSGARQPRLEVTVSDGSRPPRALASAVQAQGTVRVPPSSAAAPAFGGCHTLRVRAVLRDGTKMLARATRVLPPVAPDCARFFNARSIWNRPLAANAPVDPRSGLYVDELRRQVQKGFSVHFYPNINTTSYSTPVYTVPADQKRVPVKMYGRGAAHYARFIASAMRRGVPIPPNAKPAVGTDRHMVVWQPATDTMWELWKATNVKGRWLAEFGGMMTHVSRSPGYFYDPSGTEPGATATSLPLVGGLITLADLRRGRIDHALAMAIPYTRASVWSLPAQRTDGYIHDVNAIPEGARFRLDPRLNVDALHLPRFTAMLAKAAQRYGILLRDKSAVVSFYAQDPSPTGTNPWTAALTPSKAEIMHAFPWDHLQVMRTELRTWSRKTVAR
jgi:hypothetical protein